MALTKIDIKKDFLFANLIVCSFLFSHCTPDIKPNNETDYWVQQIQNYIDSVKKDLKLDRYTVCEYNLKNQLVKETEYDSLDKKTFYHAIVYDSFGRIKEEKDYECCWSLFARYENIYNPDSTLSKRVTYMNDKISSYIVYTYKDKKVILNEFYDENDKLKQLSTVDYDKNGKTSKYTFKKGDKVLFYDEYKYDQNSSITTKFDSHSHINGITEDTYDSDENLIKRVQKDSLNNIIKTLKWTYLNKKLQCTSFINDKNKVRTLAVDFYDKIGRLKKTDWYYERE